MKSISLFSGAGGLDVASFLADVPVAFSIDIEKDCIETLKLNELFHETTTICGDLSKFSSNKMRSRILIFVAGNHGLKIPIREAVGLLA